MPRTHARDLARQEFGRLKVEAETDARACNGEIVWRCKCRCGSIVFVITGNLTTGNTLSCGCWQQEISRRPNGVRPRYASRLR